MVTACCIIRTIGDTLGCTPHQVVQRHHHFRASYFRAAARTAPGWTSDPGETIDVRILQPAGLPSRWGAGAVLNRPASLEAAAEGDGSYL